MVVQRQWPDEDATFCAQLASAPARGLHELMCACAEHALAECAPWYRQAGYTLLPESEPLEVKRRWLRGEATDEEVQQAQAGAVFHCYWGNPIALGAAVLGAAWIPGSGLALAEDEHYAESMTWYDSAAEAALDVLSECVTAVGEVRARAVWRREDPAPAGAARLEAENAEKAWQRERAAALLRPGP